MFRFTECSTTVWWMTETGRGCTRTLEMLWTKRWKRTMTHCLNLSPVNKEALSLKMTWGHSCTATSPWVHTFIVFATQVQWSRVRIPWGAQIYKTCFLSGFFSHSTKAWYSKLQENNNFSNQNFTNLLNAIFSSKILPKSPDCRPAKSKNLPPASQNSVRAQWKNVLYFFVVEPESGDEVLPGGGKCG